MKIGEGSAKGCPASRGKPLGKTLMIGHINLEGMAKGIYHKGDAAKKTPNPIFRNRLMRMEKKEPIFSLININKGICQAKVINKTRLAIKLLKIGRGNPNSVPITTKAIKKNRFVRSNNTVFMNNCESHSAFL